MSRPPSLAVLALTIAGTAIAAAVPAQRLHPSAREDVLGTTATWTLRARSTLRARQLERDVLGEVERLRRVVDTWGEDSELARALASAVPSRVSAECAALLELAERWRQRSGGAFHPGVGGLTLAWQRAAAAGREPSEAALAELVARLDGPAWDFDASSRTFIRRAGILVNLDAIAKGWILEHASALTLDGATVEVLDIGGDIRVRAASPRAITVADPRQPADNGKPLDIVWLTDAAIATSGHHARGVSIDGRHHSHILDPRTGRPCSAVLGATVIAADGATADVLATALCVLGPRDGLSLVESVEHAAAVLVTADGEVHRSSRWSSFCEPPADNEGDGTTATAPAPPIPSDAASAWPDERRFEVEFEVGNAASAPEGRRRGGYRRPYVAVWIEDAEGKAVRTLALWVERERWLPDLRRWYRLHRGRVDWIATRSQATRKPGAYQLTWDGRDDAGQAVGLGHYVLSIEAVREHGSYQLMRQPLDLNGAAIETELPGNAEIARAVIRFTKGNP